MFKERENVPYLGPQVGTVVSASPIMVSLGDTIILDSTHLIIAAHVINGYERKVEISEGTGVTNLVQPPPPDQPNTSETWGIVGMQVSGTMKYTDTLKVGDEVILMPSTDEQRYFLIDKVVRL